MTINFKPLLLKEFANIRILNEIDNSDLKIFSILISCLKVQ